MATGQVMLEPAERDRADEPARMAQRLITFALWAVAVAIVTGWLTLVTLHLTDEYRVEHLQGNWVAITEVARTGHLYPPPFDGEYYAGTRWMPLAILANALASALVGDPLIGGKLLAAVLLVTLLVLCAAVLRQVSCPWPITAALCASVIATETVLQAGTTIGGDLLPVVLQVAAVAVALRRGDGASLVFAGALAGLALTSKLTAVWALLAVPTWLAAHRRWRAVAIFAAAAIATVAVALGAVEVITKGGLSRHLQWFSTAGVVGTPSLWRAPNQLLYNLRDHASGAVVLLPLAVPECPAVQRRAPSVADPLRARVCVPVDPRDLFRPGHRLEPVSGSRRPDGACRRPAGGPRHQHHLFDRRGAFASGDSAHCDLGSEPRPGANGGIGRAALGCRCRCRPGRSARHAHGRGDGATRRRVVVGGSIDRGGARSAADRAGSFHAHAAGPDTSGVGRPAHRPNHGAPVRPRCPHRISRRSERRLLVDRLPLRSSHCEGTSPVLQVRPDGRTLLPLSPGSMIIDVCFRAARHR